MENPLARSTVFPFLPHLSIRSIFISALNVGAGELAHSSHPWLRPVTFGVDLGLVRETVGEGRERTIHLQLMDDVSVSKN